MRVTGSIALVIRLLALAALAAPSAAEAQPGRTYRLGFLGAASPPQYARQVEAMREGLRQLGYVEGKNLIIEYRWAGGAYERLGDLAAELARLKVDVIVTHGTPGSQAAQRATRSIPIVMAIVGNPEETGLVQSLARPGGNITGSSFSFNELNAKRVEIVRDGVPALTRVATLSNPDNPASAPAVRAMEAMAQSLRLRFHRAEARRPDDLEPAFALIKPHADAVAVIDDGMLIANARRIADIAVRYRLPVVGFKELVEAGGLIAYAVDFPEAWSASMRLVDRILKGARPGDLPVQRATRFELIVNLKTAKSLGLTIPDSFLVRADQVIE
jgi:putative ABC transport system substrate-binding protein